MKDVYRNVMVALDNSECSNYATKLAVELARATGAKLTGLHVYAAGLHDDRFRQVEPGLPERYQSEDILEHQRDIHEDLIGRGLRIISDSYLAVFTEESQSTGVEAFRKALEGRNYEEIVRDVRVSGYDLVALGAHGLGRTERSTVGSVCERVARLVECDLLVARNERLLHDGPLLVAIDGSASAFAALDLAVELSQTFGNQVVAVAAYDPYFHNLAFHSLSRVLTEEAAKLFRFEEQERLHKEIIDKGLTRVYRSHLLQAREHARARGCTIGIKVLEGKPFDAIAREAERLRPTLLLVGRSGIHCASRGMLGSAAENLLRSAPCNLLIVNHQPNYDK